MISPSFAYQQRCADPAFRRAWDRAREQAPQPEWQRTFLRVLAEQQSVQRAIAAAGRAPSYVYRVRALDAEFRALWDEALAVPRQRPAWQAVFLSALAETKHITCARLAAGVASSLVYRVRAQDPEFRARWDEALNGSLPPDNDPQTPP